MSKVKGVYMERRRYHSKAWLALTGHEKSLLMFFLHKRQMKNIGRGGKEKWVCTNNGDIFFPYKEAEKYGISQSTFNRAIKKLIKVGFVDIGYLGGGMRGDCSKYAISERWRKFGDSDFVEMEKPKNIGNYVTKENHKERFGKNKTNNQK